MPKYKRRLVPIVDRQFQFKYTAIIVLVAAIISSVLGFMLLSAYQEMTEMMAIDPLIADAVNADDATFVFRTVIGFLVAEVVFLGLLGLLITHRVCGPVFVLNRHLATVLDGRYPMIRPLRSGDEFREAFQTVVDLVDNLRTRDEGERDALRDFIEHAKANALSEADVDRLQKMLDERQERLKSA